MVQQVRGFADQPLVFLCDRRERDFHAFLADLLRDARRPFRTGARCSCPPGWSAIALLDDALRAAQEREPRGVAVASSPKQVSVPLWQRAARRAVTSSVSRSQSAATSTRSSEWPEVSPFSHSRCLLRLKNDARCSAQRARAALRDSCSRASAPAPLSRILHDRRQQAVALVRSRSAVDLIRASWPHLDACAAQDAS